jgi:hypothetical protein
MKMIFNKYLLGKNLKNFLEKITEIIQKNLWFKKIEKPISKKDYIFNKNTFCALSIDQEKVSSINIIGDVHASYDIFGLFYNFFLNSKNGDYIICVGDYVDKDYSSELYCSIFNLLITGLLNAFFIQKENNINEIFGENYPAIILNRGNHETLNYVRSQLLNKLIEYNLLNRNEIYSIYENYTKEAYFYETIINIKNHSTFLVGHSVLLEFLKFPIDCNKLKKNDIKYFYKNILNTKDIENEEIITLYKKVFKKEKNQENIYDFKSIINCQKKYYLQFFKNLEWRTSARLIGDPSFENFTPKSDDIFFKLKSAKNIFDINYKNTEPVKFIAFGHSHFTNEYGSWITKELSEDFESISSYGYRIKNNFNNELYIESIDIKKAF